MNFKIFTVKIELECRVCLDQSKNLLSSIFETDLLDGYERCSSLKVSHEDPYPKYLCSVCCSLVRSFNAFRQRCMDSQIKCQTMQELENPHTKRTVSKNEFQFEEKPRQADIDVNNDPDPLRSMTLNKSDLSNITMKIFGVDNTSTFKSFPIAKVEKASLTNLIVTNDVAADATTLKSTPIIKVYKSNLPNDVFIDISTNVSSLKSIPIDRVKNPTLTDLNMDSDNADDGSTSESIPTDFPEERYQDLELNEIKAKKEHIKRKGKKEININVVDCNIAQKKKSPRKNRRKGKLKEKMIGGQCDICQKRFLYKNSLISHIRRCTFIKDMENASSKLCGICEETFQSTNELNQHLGFHQSTNTMECKICPYKAIDFADIFTHRFSHQRLGFKSRMYCFLCSRLYRKITTLEYHFRGVHLNKEKPGLCKTCKKEFKCYKHYVEHLRMHMGKVLTCDQCPKQFKYEGLLYRHKQTHSEEKKYMCHLCGFSSKQASGLRSHTFHRHKHHEPIICNHCGKTFKNPQSHRAHMLRVEGGNVLCPVCSKSYRSEKEMLNHFKWHTNNKPYVCDICGSAYKAKCHLKVHTRVHTGETPYACDICDMRFITTNSFSRHVLIHSGEKPYMCGICEKKFAMKSNLKKHIARHETSKKIEHPKL